MELDYNTQRSKYPSHQQVVKGSQNESALPINLYKSPPFGQLTLEECQDLFRQRLEVLNVMEKTDQQNQSLISSFIEEIKSYAYKTNCIKFRKNDPHQQKLDHFSHMLLRMYCIYNNNLWDWFKRNERRLLNYRLRNLQILSGTQFEKILSSFNFNFQRVLGTELDQLHKERLIGWDKIGIDREVTDVFKVHFSDALYFIGKRSVGLKGGYAYLTRREIITVICDVFEKHLDNELNFARQHLDVEKTQVRQLLDSLSMVYLDYQEKIEDEERKRKGALSNGGHYNPFTIDIKNLPELVKNHYPPCMRYLHETLLTDHHLKHQARLYYGAFLRSGGVDMETALEFWRGEFTKNIANDKFDRDYKYNIRHLYGQEGHKKALSCFTCDKIINDNPPGPSEKHGCPFKHFDDNNLKNMLVKHGLKEVDIESIMMYRNDKEYKLACSNYFKFLKGELPDEPVKNPIYFFNQSMALSLRPPKIEKEDEQALTEAEVLPPQPSPPNIIEQVQHAINDGSDIEWED